jgi:cbb3-type cytochrome oxidase maturation protein
MIGAGLALFAVCLAGYAWAARGGQFDDLDTPAWRALDDAAPLGPKASRLPDAPPLPHPPIGPTALHPDQNT